MTNEELEARFADFDEQLKTLFAYHGHNWTAIKRQRRDNASAQAHVPQFTVAQEHGGTARPKDHERQ
jgi:hypothetical protein